MKDRTGEVWGITEMDAPALVGMDPHKGLLTLYGEKKGLIPARDAAAVRLEQAMGAFIERLWTERTGKKCRRAEGMRADGEKAYFRSSVGRKVLGEKAALVCRAANPWSRTDFQAGEMEPRHIAQCQWMISVCGLERVYLAALDLASRELYDRVIYPDPEMIRVLRRAGERFWEGHVLPEVPPPPDGSESAGETLKKLLGCRQGVAPLEEQAALLRGYEALGQTIEDLRRDRERLAQQVQMAMEGCDQGEGGGYRVSWRGSVRESVDAKALKRALPQVYRQFVRESPCRVFRVTKLREGGGVHVD